MSILPTWTDYTNKDFDSIRDRLFSLIDSVFPTWSDKESHNFGNILLELYAFLGDVLFYYQDNQAREGRFGYVRQRKNIIALCKLIAYELSGSLAATADLEISVRNAVPGTVLVPAGALVKTQSVTDPIEGETQSAGTIPVGGTLSVGWEHSRSKSTTVSATGREQEVCLPRGPYLDGSAEVATTSYPTGWTKVDNFLSSGPTDLHFTVTVDQNDRATVKSGDGVNGRTFDGLTTISYKVGGGREGNIEAGDLKKIEGTFTDSFGNPAYLSVTNPNAAQGGWPRETVAAARQNAPASLRVLNRTVSREDYEINALRVDGVGRSLMLTSNEDPGIDENHGRLYILPVTGGTPSQLLLDDVEEMVSVTYPKTITFQLEVLPVVFLDVDVEARIWIEEGYDATSVKATIESDLAAFFQPLMDDGTVNPEVDFGFNYKDQDGEPAGEVAWSDVFNVVRDAAGVRKVGAGLGEFTLNGVHDDVPIDNREFPALGTVTLIDGSTGNTI